MFLSVLNEDEVIPDKCITFSFHAGNELFFAALALVFLFSPVALILLAAYHLLAFLSVWFLLVSTGDVNCRYYPHLFCSLCSAIAFAGLVFLTWYGRQTFDPLPIGIIGLAGLVRFYLLFKYVIAGYAEPFNKQNVYSILKLCLLFDLDYLYYQYKEESAEEELEEYLVIRDIIKNFLGDLLVIAACVGYMIFFGEAHHRMNIILGISMLGPEILCLLIRFLIMKKL